jgi:protein subunit release factor B
MNDMPGRIRDIRIEYYRSRGPGGQRKNKKETAVRIRHIPTGITAIATEFRSQARNRQLALKRLKERLERLKRKKKRRIPTKISVSAKERILKKKRLRSEKKRLRQKVVEW